jgi:hypothetical protein
MAAAGVENLTLSGERAPGPHSHANICGEHGEKTCEQFTSTSEIPVDELNTKRWRDALFTSPQRSASVAASYLHSQGQSPAEVQVEGRTVRVDKALDSEAQREFIEPWKRKQEENDTLEFMDAPDAAASQGSALSIHVCRAAPGTPRCEISKAQDRPEFDPQGSTHSITRVALPTVASRITDAEHRCGSWCAPPINTAGNAGQSAVERAETDIYARKYQPRREHGDSPATTVETRPDE